MSNAPENSPNRPVSSRHWWRIGIAISAALVLMVLVLGPLLISRANRILRAKAAQTLRNRFDSEVEIRELQLSVFPRLQLTAKGVVMRYQGRRDIPPLISIDHLEAEGGMVGLLSVQPHVQSIRLQGLAIHVPHRSAEEKARAKSNGRKSGAAPYASVVVEKIVADGAHLEILPGGPGKDPLVFDIHALDMREVSLDRPAQFTARLSNPKPRGEIETAGLFGPWQASSPGDTPLNAKYTFSDADLSTFKGIGGWLTSKGKFQGVLERIEVDGETDTPDFYLSISGNRMPLHTQFHSIVDGTNGNTWLLPVHAKLQGSSFDAKGGVVRVVGAKGRDITLDVLMPAGRLEDLLRLAVKSEQPIITGAIRFKTRLELPPGDVDVIEKLRLQGEFSIQNAHFTSVDVRERLRGLSRRAQGAPTDETAGSSVSNMNGQFRLRGGVASFSDLTFELEGAAIRLAGNYSLRSEKLEFYGAMRMDAKISQATTGFKAFLLKAVDPFFSDGKHGALIPIKITGTRSAPAFGLDLSRKGPKPI